MGSWVDLAQPVMGNGSAHLHVVGERGVRLAGKMEGSSPDVGLICVGYPPTPFPTPLQSIVGDPGAFAFNTVNNIWGDKRTAHSPTAHHDSTVQYSVVLRALRVLTVDVSVVCGGGVKVRTIRCGTPLLRRITVSSTEWKFDCNDRSSPALSERGKVAGAPAGSTAQRRGGRLTKRKGRPSSAQLGLEQARGRGGNVFDSLNTNPSHHWPNGCHTLPFIALNNTLGCIVVTGINEREEEKPLGGEDAEWKLRATSIIATTLTPSNI